MAQLWREIKEMATRAPTTRWQNTSGASARGSCRPPVPPARAAGTVGRGRTKETRHESQETARLLILEARNPPEALRPEQRRWLEEVRERCPDLAMAQELVESFAGIVRGGEAGGLAGWLGEAERSYLPEIRTFARGVRQDEAAVEAAISLPWSKGQVEGHLNRLKMLKRQMYGRAGFELLKRRVLGSAA